MEQSLRILVADDDAVVRKTLADFLRRAGHAVDQACDGASAVESMSAEDYDLVLLDIRLPDTDGFAILEKMRDMCPDTAAVIVTGHGNMDSAVRALRLGAADFLTKPVGLGELEAVIEKGTRLLNLRRGQRKLRATIGALQAPGALYSRRPRIVAVSNAMKAVCEQVRQAVEAHCDTVLVTGETGTGKEVVAREIHLQAGSSEAPFIAVSCPALPDTLVESELFGSVKGAYTGSTESRAGCFELADGGTLFLDEVGDLSVSAQSKLLRVLETRSVRRVGGSKEVSVNIRLVAATNAPLESLVETGRFRPDLFYRLNVFRIHIPPLRERRESIVALAEHLLGEFARSRGMSFDAFTPEARELLEAYDYPGNVRELRNIVERAAILARSGSIDAGHLSLSQTRTGAAPTPPGTPQDEKSRLLQALEITRWNRRLAAKELGMAYSTLRFKLKQYGIS